MIEQIETMLKPKPTPNKILSAVEAYFPPSSRI